MDQSLTFFETVLLCKLGWSGTCSIGQSSLGFKAFLPLPPKCWTCRLVCLILQDMTFYLLGRHLRFILTEKSFDCAWRIILRTAAMFRIVQSSTSSAGHVVPTCDHRTQRQRQIALSSRPTWSIEQVLGQLSPHTNPVSKQKSQKLQYFVHERAGIGSLSQAYIRPCFQSPTVHESDSKP